MANKKKNFEGLYIVLFGLFLVGTYFLSSYFFCLFAGKVGNFTIINYSPGNSQHLATNDSNPEATATTTTTANTEMPPATTGATPDTSSQGFDSVSTSPGHSLFSLEGLAFTSFFDSFDNDSLVDKEKTDLYLDPVSAAVFFQPDYDWQIADTGLVSKNKSKLDYFTFSNFSDNYLDSSYDKRCIGSNCLEQKGKSLVYKNKNIYFPGDIKTSDVVAISIKQLDKTWLVGFTLKHGNNYEGLVYSYDGSKFTRRLSDKSISSTYFGIFGFGGEESDFIAVYGAYKGIAYRVQGDNVSDVSRFFDFRPMDKGFRPEIIKAKNANYENWYVFSLSDGKAKFFKLWENSDKEIMGEVSYSNILDGAPEVSFALLNNNSSEINFLAKLKMGDTYYWKSFSDRGFKNKSDGLLFFKPIINNPPASIRKIANFNLGSRDYPFNDGQLLFSLDSNNWQSFQYGYRINRDFSTDAVSKIFLKATINAQKNKFYSPFLSELVFDFYYQK